MGKEGEQLLVAQNPEGCPDLQVASGNFYKMHGLDIFHKASTDCGSSGSPLITCDGKVIGIHKCRAAMMMINTTLLFQLKLCMLQFGSLKLIKPYHESLYNPTRFDKEYESQISQQRLKLLDKTYKIYPVIYECPYTHDPTIWFVPTSHGWYWTPTNLLKYALDACGNFKGYRGQL